MIATSRANRFGMIAAVLVSLTLAGSAGAVSFTFSEFAVGTVITNQYSAQGVTFAGASGADPIIADDMAMPNSPVLSPNPIFAGDFNILLDPGFDFVSFESGYWNAIGTALIQIFDQSNNLLDTLTNTLIGVETFVISGYGEIGRIYFNSFSDAAGADIDNFVATPEPTTAALLALGLVGIAVTRRRAAALW